MNKPITFKSNGNEYPLNYTFNSFCALEEELGVGMAEMLVGIGDGTVKMHTVRALLWAGLVEDNPGITLEDAGKLIPLNGMQATLEQIIAAFNASGLTEETQPAQAARSRASGRKR